MPRREREETQPEEEEDEQEIKQEVKLEYDIPMPFNDASSSSSIVDSKFVYLLHLDLSELTQKTKAILLEHEIGFKSLLEISEATLEKVGIVLGDIVSLLAFAEKCKKNDNMYPPPPEKKKAATDGFVVKLIQAFDPSISQSSLKTVFRHLRFASTEFWMLSDNDFLAILRDDEDDDDDDGSDEAIKISNAQQYLMNEEHWDEIRTVVDSESVGRFLERNPYEAQPVDSYRVPEFVSQLSRVSPKKSETVKVHCMILMNFAHLSDEGMKLLGRQEIVDALVASSRYVTSAEAVHWWSGAIYGITCNNESNNEIDRKFFGCEPVRDSFVVVSKYATSPEAVRAWSTVIASITYNNEFNEKIFGCEPVVDCFVSVSKYVTIAETVHAWSAAIFNICHLECNEKFFGCQPIVDSFVDVSKYATSADAVYCWSSAICNISHLESNRKLFGCQPVVDSFVSVSRYATSTEAVYWWISAISNITLSNDVDVRRVFSSSAEFKEVFFSLKQNLEQMREDEDSREAKKRFDFVEKKLF